VSAAAGPGAPLLPLCICCELLFFFPFGPFPQPAESESAAAVVAQMFVKQKVDDEIITFLNAPDRTADKQREQEASGQNTLQGAVIAWTLCVVSSTSHSAVKKAVC